MSLELQRTSHGERSTTSRHEDDVTELGQILPPTDMGSAAYKFLFGCFVLEGLLWGMYFVFPHQFL